MHLLIIILRVCIVLLFVASAHAQKEVPFDDFRYICVNGLPACRITAREALKPGFKTSYSWSTGATTREITLLYKDFKYGKIVCRMFCECGGEAVSQIYVSLLPEVFKLDIVNSSCNQANDGIVRLITNNSEDQLVWQGQESKEFTHLNAGNYQFQVKNRFGCYIAQNVEIKEPPSFPADHSLMTNGVSCFEKKDGSAEISFGNTALNKKDLSVTWQNGVSGFSVAGLAAGSYFLKVRYGTACNTLYFDIWQPSQLIMDYQLLSNFNGYAIRCFDSKDGQASIWASGGVWPYTLSFKNSDFFQATTIQRIYLDSLSQGEYPVVVRDRHQCVVKSTLPIKGPRPITFNHNSDIFNGYDVACNKSSLQLNPSVSGGAGGFAYNWTRRQPGNDTVVSLSPYPLLDPGEYKVMIEDVNSCSATFPLLIQQPETVDYDTKFVIRSWPFKLAILKLNGGWSKKYYVDGKPRKRKFIISFFKKEKVYEFNASADDCDSRRLSFIFPLKFVREHRKKIKRARGDLPCPDT